MDNSILSHHRNQSKDKYTKFEDWLRENGAQFDMVELREYATTTSSLTTNNDGEEDKKDDDCAPKQQQHGTTTINTISMDELNINGSNDHHVPMEVAEEESEMRGVHAKCTIPSNTVCISIPKQCLITVEMGQTTEIGQAILNADLDLDAPKHVFLMVYLLVDRLDPNSFFKPYYDILPKKLENMPVFWDEEDLSYLKGSFLLQQIEDRNEAIEEDYESICTVAPQLRQIATLEEFKWARMCVCSRNFGLIINGIRTSALVPHADMLNHFRPRETKWTFDNDRQAFTITTLQAIPQNSQVYDSYGQKCNHRFLLNYGFAIENNCEADGYCPNEVSIEIAPSLYSAWLAEEEASGLRVQNSFHRSLAPDVSSSQLQDDNDQWTEDSVNSILSAYSMGRAGMMGSNFTSLSSSAASISGLGIQELAMVAQWGVNTKRIRVSVSNNENTKALMSMLRVMCADEEELKQITSGGIYLYCTSRGVRASLTKKNEKSALRLLRFIVRNALSKYPTTLSQDAAALLRVDQLPPFSNRRHAIIQVKGEKEVLHHFEDLANTALSIMDLDDAEFDRAMKAIQERKHFTILHYCMDQIASLRKDEMKQRIRVSSTMVVPPPLSDV